MTIVEFPATVTEVHDHTVTVAVSYTDLPPNKRKKRDDGSFSLDVHSPAAVFKVGQRVMVIVQEIKRTPAWVTLVVVPLVVGGVIYFLFRHVTTDLNSAILAAVVLVPYYSVLWLIGSRRKPLIKIRPMLGEGTF